MRARSNTKGWSGSGPSYSRRRRKTYRGERLRRNSPRGVQSTHGAKRVHELVSSFRRQVHLFAQLKSGEMDTVSGKIEVNSLGAVQLTLYL